MKIGDKVRPNLKKQSIQEGFESEYFSDVRAALLRGDSVTGCVRCYEEEAMGIKSYRQYSLDRFPAVGEKPVLQSLELAFSNECNLKCRMCNPTESRKWNSDWKVMFPQTDEEISDYNWAIANDITPLADVNYIKVVGGEPFLSKEFEKFLEASSAENRSQNIQLDCHTNSTFFPKPSVLENLKKFKKIKLFLSIDAAGPLAEYIRCGVTWEKVSQTALNWINLSKEHSHIEVIVYPTFQIYNAHAIMDLAHWAWSIDVAHFGGNFVNDPEYLSMDILPHDYKEKILKIYEDKSYHDFNASYQQTFSHFFSRLQEKQIDSGKRKKLFDQFIHFDNKLSELRSQSLSKVIPGLHEYTQRQNEK